MSHLCYNYFMERINKRDLINYYINKYKINDYFSFSIIDKAELFSFSKNEIIITQGYPSDYLYMLVRGEITLFSLTEDNGRYISLGSIKPFHFIGEMASLQNDEPFNNVQASSAVYCLALSYQKYRQQLLDDPKFLRMIISLLTDRCEILNNNIISYQNDSTKQRLATLILLNSLNNVLNVNLRYCSDAIGCSYRHCIRMINDLCQNNILEKKNKKYHIINRKALEQMSSTTYFSDQDIPKSRNLKFKNYNKL